MSRLETNDLGYLIWDVPVEVASTSSKFGVTIVYTIKKLPQLTQVQHLKICKQQNKPTLHIWHSPRSS